MYFFPIPDLSESVYHDSRELRHFFLRICQFRGPVAKRFNDPIVHVEPTVLIDRFVSVLQC